MAAKPKAGSEGRPEAKPSSATVRAPRASRDGQGNKERAFKGSDPHKSAAARPSSESAKRKEAEKETAQKV